MWTDHQGKSTKDVISEITLLQTSVRTGQIVEISINGVKTRYSENTGIDWSKRIKSTIEDLQEYLWRLENGHSSSAVIRPRAFRNRQTIVTNL